MYVSIYIPIHRYVFFLSEPFKSKLQTYASLPRNTLVFSGEQMQIETRCPKENKKELAGCKLGDGGDPENKVPGKGMGPHLRSQMVDEILSGQFHQGQH